MFLRKVNLWALARVAVVLHWAPPASGISLTSRLANLAPSTSARASVPEPALAETVTGTLPAATTATASAATAATATAVEAGPAAAAAAGAGAATAAEAAATATTNDENASSALPNVNAPNNESDVHSPPADARSLPQGCTFFLVRRE